MIARAVTVFALAGLMSLLQALAAQAAIPEVTILERIGALGLGGLVAVLVLYWKRADDKAHSEALERKEKAHREEMKRVLERVEKNESATREVLNRVIDSLDDLSDAIKSFRILERVDRRLSDMEKEQRTFHASK